MAQDKKELYICGFYLICALFFTYVAIYVFH